MYNNQPQPGTIQRHVPRVIVERMPREAANNERLTPGCLETGTSPHADIEPRDVSILIHSDYDIRRLVVAVIAQAVRDARKDTEARAWLMGEGMAWLEACGLDRDYLATWLERTNLLTIGQPKPQP